MTEQEYEKWLLGPLGGGLLKVKMFSAEGAYAGVKPLIFHYTMIFGIIGDTLGYEKRYCYKTIEGALQALEAWDGTGDPEGWHRAPDTARRRPDGDPTREYKEG